MVSKAPDFSRGPRLHFFFFFSVFYFSIHIFSVIAWHSQLSSRETDIQHPNGLLLIRPILFLLSDLCWIALSNLAADSFVASILSPRPLPVLVHGPLTPPSCRSCSLSLTLTRPLQWSCSLCDHYTLFLSLSLTHALTLCLSHPIHRISHCHHHCQHGSLVKFSDVSI